MTENYTYRNFDPVHLLAFVKESNAIERIFDTTERHVKAHEKLLRSDRLTLDVVTEFVQTVQPDAVLRDRDGLNVMVGNHFPPPGGLDIRLRLEDLLKNINDTMLHPLNAHFMYENLHPYTDGNGRSGRAIWLWHMMYHHPDTELGDLAINGSFLHRFYYQALEAQQ